MDTNLHTTPAFARPIPVDVVIPCYNEQESLPKLAKALEALRLRLGKHYSASFIFVDDGSTDATPELLQRLFGANNDCKSIRLEPNQGIAAALLAGIQNSSAEIVCTIDSDCSYDPCELAHMIPMLIDGVQVVTASPYHAEGRVLDVPASRLILSKAASRLYRLVLHQKLATYTSCFRVYRRSAIASLAISDYRFAGVAEILGRLDLQGAVIIEYPTTLRVRSSGSSKMKLCRTIIAQLAVLFRLGCARWLHERHASEVMSLERTFSGESMHHPAKIEILTVQKGRDHATDH
jgi:glycosyltransferase involved in cell wall biosynthesis